MQAAGPDTRGARWRWLLPAAFVPGTVLATLFFVASLTPSLVPRGLAVQGVLSGVSIAAGYGLGAALAALWRLLELPRPGEAAARRLWPVAAGLSAAVGAVALWQASRWQDGLRSLMGLPPVEEARPLAVLALALVVFWVILLVARLIRGTARAIAARVGRVLPGPQAALVAIALTALLFWNLGNGVIVRGAMTLADRAYARYDALFEDSVDRPTTAAKTGGPGSLIDWDDLGRAGREMVAAGPDAAAIARLAGGAPAGDPLRVYVGLNAASGPRARAELALAELIRVGGFDRANLVIVTPTGTGWVDPESQAALEYILRGDVASVSVQYSYLASWIALLAQPDYGLDTAREVFAAVYGHWRTLPADRRPRLWLHGLSLGAYYSDLSHDLYQVIGEPYQGALWSGPPFNSRTWTAVTRVRNAGTPAWLPAFRDGSVIRFMGTGGAMTGSPADWGPYRVLYLQYASDAVSFFDPNAFWRRPPWLTGTRGPDVAPGFRWLPVVSGLQLTVDMMTAVAPPLGHGHNYRFGDYVTAWADLTAAPGWDADARARLIAAFEAARP